MTVLAAQALAAAPQEGMAAVDPDAWDAIARPGQAPIRHGWFTAWETAELRGLRSRPLVAHRHGTDEIAVAVPAYFYDLDMAVVQSPALENAISHVRRLWPRLMVARVLEIGTPTPLVPPFLRAPDVSAREAARVIAEAALAEAEAGDAKMVIAQSFESAEGETADALRAAGFRPVPIPPTVVVDLPWSSFDEYLGAMRAQYRRRAKKVLKESRHLRAEHVRDFAGLVPELARLWRLVHDRAQEVKREVLGEPFFRGVAEQDDSSVLLLRREDGSIASYALLADDRPWLHFLYTGFEERAGVEEAAYFRLLYELVRHGIEHGFHRINLGLTTLPPKLDAGGVPVHLYAWLKHRRPLLHEVFTRAGAGPFAPSRVEPRNVFKD
jgi:predicted N-acyltransferase